jgi:HAE1 family hydrophobic/amphiphilic exporter-1
MAEVIRTLVIAFVLVGIVVFLFLGKLRTTLIPLFAVPVSIIGTFAVMLAIGYSANTVSLLALVLAIGIVVDDAIVVIENVERVIEEEPELSIAAATKKAMARSPGRSSRSPSSCCRCSCRWRSSPASAASSSGSSPWPCRSRC